MVIFFKKLFLAIINEFKTPKYIFENHKPIEPLKEEIQYGFSGLPIYKDRINERGEYLDANGRFCVDREYFVNLINKCNEEMVKSRGPWYHYPP